MLILSYIGPNLGKFPEIREEEPRLPDRRCEEEELLEETKITVSPYWTAKELSCHDLELPADCPAQCLEE